MINGQLKIEMIDCLTHDYIFIFTPLFDQNTLDSISMTTHFDGEQVQEMRRKWKLITLKCYGMLLINHDSMEMGRLSEVIYVSSIL